MELNVERPEQEHTSPFFFFFGKKVKVMCFFFFCILTYIKPAEGEKRKSLPTPRVLIWPTAAAFESPKYFSDWCVLLLAAEWIKLGRETPAGAEMMYLASM